MSPPDEAGCVAHPASTASMTRRQRSERTDRALRTAARSRSAGRREALLDYVARLNLHLAHDVAGRHMRPGLDNDEILQRAYEALARAARDYDLGSYRDFRAYAVSEIQRELEERGPRTGAVPGAAGWTPGT